MRKHVDEWVNEVRCLSDIARTQPHAAYSAFVHGLTGHWSHIMHTIPDIGNLLAALENVIHQEFIPSLSGRPASSSVERKVFALPARLGGLGLINPTACADRFFQFSIKQTKMLVDLIVSQQLSGEVDLERTLSAKKEIKQLSRLIAIQQASDLDKFLDQHQKSAYCLKQGKGLVHLAHFPTY